jgi:hypothetical protein
MNNYSTDRNIFFFFQIKAAYLAEVCTRCGYEVPGMILLRSIPVYLQLTERGHLRSTSIEQLCTYFNDVATVGNIFGTPVVQ